VEKIEKLGVYKDNKRRYVVGYPSGEKTTFVVKGCNTPTRSSSGAIIFQLVKKIDEIIDYLNQEQPEEGGKKNWKKRFEGLDFMVKVKDSFGWTKEINYEMLEDFIQQEIDRARGDIFTKEEFLMLKLAMNYIYNNGNTAYEDLSRKINKLSKLTK